MKPEELKSIKESFERSRKYAERIMEGEVEYDGADGAREVIDLCCMAETLIVALEAKAEKGGR